MKKNRILMYLGLFSVGVLPAQSLSPSVVSAEGELSETDEISLEWTLGEVFIHTVQHDNGIITQGVQQPLLQIEQLEMDAKEIASLPVELSSVEVYPNPVSGVLHIKQSTVLFQLTTISLVDFTGKKLIQLAGEATSGPLEIDMSFLPAGIYFLVFETTEGQYLKRYKVTKSGG